jgi:hypothetical protein
MKEPCGDKTKGEQKNAYNIQIPGERRVSNCVTQTKQSITKRVAQAALGLFRAGNKIDAKHSGKHANRDLENEYGKAEIKKLHKLMMA